jgi:hypothetical protein
LQEHEADLQSRRIMVQCFFSANSNIDDAVAAYKRQVRAGVALPYSRYGREMRYNLCKWVETGSVQNRPHSKQQQELPDEVVKQFAYKLAMGYAHHCYLEKNGQLTEAWEHRPFNTLADAAQHDPYIRDVLQTCGSQQQLMRRAKALDPELAWGYEHIKEDIPQSLKAERQAFAKQQLQRAQEDPSFLLDMVCMDEVKFYIANDRDGKVRVWGHKSDLSHAEPTPCPLLGSHNQVCLNLMLVVSPRYGVMYCDTLTGTSKVRGQLVKIAPQAQQLVLQRNGREYTVSGMLLEQDAS